ncbi:MAG: pyridoxal-phosphate dependent enzyme [Saprospiraceae bacterium]
MNEEKFLAIHNRILPFIHETPVMTSRLLNEISGGDLHFKCENFQRMGAFKMRGAANAILSLSIDEKSRGVVTHSSGNFAQATAFSGQLMGVTTYIVMPNNAPLVKKDAVKAYGGIITECGPSIAQREAAVEDVIMQTGAISLHPSNQDEVILGNSTIGVEFFNQVSDLQRIIVPVGGGGMIAGIALAAEAFSETCEVIGAEPAAAADAQRSLREGKIQKNDTANTIADGLRTHLGDRNFPIIQRLVKDIITVEEDEIIIAMKLIWERLKIIIEPSAAVAVAVALKEKKAVRKGKTGIVLSGGNVDLGNLPF